MQLVTRADWDGLVCAVLLDKAEKIDGIFFVHPKDVQDGKVKVPPGCIIANLPYHPHCAYWFDHHISEDERARAAGKFAGRYELAPSTARLIYDYYGGAKLFGGLEALVAAADKIDSADLTMEDVLYPQGYVLLAYTIDPRTGLVGGTPHQPYFLMLMELLQTKTIAEILEYPEVKARCERLSDEQAEFRRALLLNSRQEANVVITDFRGLPVVPAGNRFLIYALFPEANVSVRLFDGRGGRFVVAAVGHSIFNRTCKTNIGELLSSYGGGGHRGAGSVQFAKEEANARIGEIIARLQNAG